MTEGLASAKSTLQLKNYGMCRADYEWRLHLDQMKAGEVVEDGPFLVGGFQWMLAARLCCEGIDNRTVLQLLAVSLNAVPVHARYKFYPECGNETASSHRTSKTVCPYGCMAKCELMIDLVNRHEEGPPLSDELKVNFSLKNVRAPTNEEKNKISSMTRVKVEIFDRETIEDWLDDNTYGILPERSERVIFVWHDSLIRYWPKNNPEYRYWTCDRAHGGDLFLKQCFNDAKPTTSFGDVSQAVEKEGLLTKVFEETRSHGKDPESIRSDTMFLLLKVSEPPFTDATYIGHFFVQDTTTVHDLLKTASELTHIGDEVPHKVLAEVGSLCVKDLANEQGTLQECEWLHSGSAIVVKLEDASEVSPHRPRVHMIEE